MTEADKGRGGAQMQEAVACRLQRCEVGSGALLRLTDGGR